MVLSLSSPDYSKNRTLAISLHLRQHDPQKIIYYAKTYDLEKQIFQLDSKAYHFHSSFLLFPIKKGLMLDMQTALPLRRWL